MTGIGGATQPSSPSSILNNTAPPPGVRLKIVTGTGEDISGTKLGEKLFLRIEIDQASIYGIFAKNLRAISPADNDKIELLDSRGCPTDPIIFPGLEKIPNSQDLQGSLKAFKFSDTSVVTFQVNSFSNIHFRTGLGCVRLIKNVQFLLWVETCSRLCGECAVGYVMVAHVILVSDPVPIGLWIFDCFGFGIGIRSMGTGLGTGA